jgi:hypothetical protein
MGWLAPTPTRGPRSFKQGDIISSQAMSYPVVQGWAVALYWGYTQPLVLDAYGGVDCLGTCIMDFYIAHKAFYQGKFTLCWNYYAAYACTPSRITTTDSDGTGPHTRVYVVKCAWALAVMPYLVR